MDNLHLVIFLSVLGAAAAGYCTSYYNSYGQSKSGFSCPRFSDSYKDVYCCGTSTLKYCCSYNGYYSNDSYWISRTIIGIIVAVGSLIFFIVLISCCCCAACPLYKRRQHGRVISTNGPTTTGATTVVYTQSSAPGMVNYGYSNQTPAGNPAGYPAGYPAAQPAAQPAPQGYSGPMPPTYASAYPPPQYLTTSPLPYPAAQQPPPPNNLYK